MFLFSTCQVGSESTFKSEVKRLFPDWLAAFSRPGFVSYKTGEDTEPDILPEMSVLARMCSVSIGNINAGNNQELAETLWNLVTQQHLFINRVHCFRRDPFAPGEKGFEPWLTAGLIARHQEIVRCCPLPKLLGTNAADALQPALTGETVLDVLETDTGRFLAGFHRITDLSPLHNRYSGGILPLQLPSSAVSRAWLKFEEGLRWSGMIIEPNSVCLDIGSSPGGSSQCLLARNAKVFGIDPGEMHETVLKHPNFTHVRKRIKGVKRQLFREADYIFADLNVAPNYTLDVLEEAVSLTSKRFKSALFTLKLIHWNLVENIPQYIDRLKQTGFKTVRVKQLAFNRQEVMVAAKVG
jgi:23S rRNA (cytidine2498-2'-O)-methyltransferase